MEHDRRGAVDILQALFRMGVPPRPKGAYNGQLIGLTTGLLADPFFEWLGRLYLPWLGKTFDAPQNFGDNVFRDNAWSKATGRLGWPEYRVYHEDTPEIVRVFPFTTEEAEGVENEGLTVLRLTYTETPNPLPVRRIVDEVVELPGGYLLGKAHMRGLREFRRVCFFGLARPESGD